MTWKRSNLRRGVAAISLIGMALGAGVWMATALDEPVGGPVCAEDETLWESVTPMLQYFPPSLEAAIRVTVRLSGAPSVPSAEQIAAAASGHEGDEPGSFRFEFPTMTVTVFKFENGMYIPGSATWCRPTPA